MIRLEVVDGASPGRVYELTGDVAFVGRAPQNEAVLDDGHVSGRHLRIVRGLDGAVTVEDLGSTNGTIVVRGDERTVLEEPGDAFELFDGDVLELGRDDEICRLAVTIVDEERSAHLVSVKSVGEEAELPDDPVTLRRIYDAQRKIGRARDLDTVLAAIAESVFDLVAHATHVTVVLQAAEATSGKKGEVKVKNFLPVLTRVRPGHSDDEGDGGRPFVPITRSVYRKVLEERAAVLAADAPKEVASTPSMMGASVRSCVAVPLWEGEEILGVLQVDNRDAPGMLKGTDLDVLLCVAEQASLAVANGRLIKRLVVAEEKARRENTFLKDREKERRGGREIRIIGNSEPMKELLVQLGKVADTNVTVLIEGETGTGKELVASALHYRSRRRDELFVAQNCAAIAETLLESELFGHVKGAFTGASDDKKGLFELADGSTLFLDEITEA
ncbi:MAG TPA: FHA domain-containing protein, partial [Polyangiaceae bacterium]|nr:FHA domain-containing protein [Polyangiaceae bacterium]